MAIPDRFDPIARKFKDAATLPEMPTATLKVNRLLDSDNVSLLEVERIIVGDPGLTAAMLRAASSAIYGEQENAVTTVRAAMMRLGVVSIKAVTLHVWTQALISQARGRSSFNPNKFRDHSSFVGYLARYVFSSRMKRSRVSSRWSPDEVFALGILHDLGVALFALVEPKEFEITLNRATVKSMAFSEMFVKTYGKPVSELGSLAITTWGLDPMFSEVISYLDNPESHPTEAVAVACVHWADRVANAHNFSLFNLPSEPMSEFADAEAGLPEEDVDMVLALIRSNMNESATPDRRVA